MTTELEQEFFKVFGVEQKTNGCEEYFYMPDAESCKECEDKPCLKHLEYPEITDRVLLELICIAYKTQDIELTVEDIKNEVINNCIKYKDDIKQHIQQLFKEAE